MLAVALSAQAAPDAVAFGERIRQSADQAQALQGPLDGSWRLCGGRRTLWLLELSDPPDGAPPAGAWRAPAAGGRLGPIDQIRREGPRLSLEFRPEPTALIRIDLRRAGRRIWRGRLTEGRSSRPAVMVRGERCLP